SKRDWSSDVCSSDLQLLYVLQLAASRVAYVCFSTERRSTPTRHNCVWIMYTKSAAHHVLFKIYFRFFKHWYIHLAHYYRDVVHRVYFIEFSVHFIIES